MKILYVAPEAVPFSKTGGLGDVAGSLPRALLGHGADVRVILPLYEATGDYWRRQMTFCKYIFVTLGWRSQYCGLFSLERDGVTYYFVDNEYYFKRPQIYGFFDDAERFAFFCRAVVELLPELGWRPDIVSCNDWQTALVPIYLKREPSDFYRGIKTVFTIHNIEYQGKYGADILEDVFGLPVELYDNGAMRYEGAVNLMKSAIYEADYITTVSPTYAMELTEPYFAAGMHNAIRDNSFKLRGIINGIDFDVYNPETDEKLPCAFSASDMSGKAANKRELQRELGLEENPDIPIIACVSRLVGHKGFDLVLAAIDTIMSWNVQLVVMGTGDHEFEQHFAYKASEYCGRMAVRIEYSEFLSARIYAGADLFLMPSRSEPCGLSQMIAMRYGTLPVVRETGGLRDTVRPWPGEGSNGFSFQHYSTDYMLGALWEATSLYRDDRASWDALRQRAAETDFGWGKSAGEYMEMYGNLLN